MGSILDFDSFSAIASEEFRRKRWARRAAGIGEPLPDAEVISHPRTSVATSLVSISEPEAKVSGRKLLPSEAVAPIVARSAPACLVTVSVEVRAKEHRARLKIVTAPIDEMLRCLDARERRLNKTLKELEGFGL